MCKCEHKDVHTGVFTTYGPTVIAKERNDDKGLVKRIRVYPVQWDTVYPLNKGSRPTHNSVLAGSHKCPQVFRPP